MALVMVADDTPEIVTMLKDIIESRGHQVATVSDGVQMIEKAKAWQPHVIVSDVMMPGTYGSSAYKALQEEATTRDIPVIFLTAITPEQAAKVIPQSPKVKVLHKPLNIGVLMAAIEEMLRLRAAAPAPAAVPPPSASASPSKAPEGGPGPAP